MTIAVEAQRYLLLFFFRLQQHRKSIGMLSSVTKLSFSLRLQCIPKTLPFVIINPDPVAMISHRLLFFTAPLLLILLALQTSAFSSPQLLSTRSTETQQSPLKLSPTDILNILPPDVTTFAAESINPEQLPAVAGVGATAVVAPQAFKLSKALSAEKKRQQARGERSYPESNAATYELLDVGLPFEFGVASTVRPLLKQTQLESRPLQVAYDANKHGYSAQTFHQKVDGKGAAVILCKAQGKWFGAYNPRGWASLGGSRPSRAAFCFYQKGLLGNSWQKLRALGGGGNACGNDLFDRGIYIGAESLVIPLEVNNNPRNVASRLGSFFETGPERRSTLLPRPAQEVRLSELLVLTGVYDKDEDIPNAGGVLDLGLY
jgi:hypothetical protein